VYLLQKLLRSFRGRDDENDDEDDDDDSDKVSERAPCLICSLY